MNDSSQSGADPTRIQTCSAVFRRIRDASDEAGTLTFRIVTDRPVDGRSYAELRSQKFRVGIGDDLTELPLPDLLFVYEMVLHDQRNKDVPEGYRQTVIGIDEIGEATATKLLGELRQAIGIEVEG
jgi:hypothetical protein